MRYVLSMTATPRENVEVAPSRRIAAEVRAEAARKGLSVRRMALAMGVSQPWLARRIGFTGDVEITFEELVRMAEALDTTAERLIATSGWLPRLDSNQQPSGERKPQVSATVTKLSEHRKRRARQSE